MKKSALSKFKIQDISFSLLPSFPLVGNPSSCKIQDYPASCILHTASFIIILLALLLLPSLSFATMGDYCLVPPYVKRDVSVNIMILMDNSNDMKNSAYGHDSDTDWDDSRYTPSATYDNYYGYFAPRGCYAPPGADTTNFKRVGAVDYTAYPGTGCPPPGSGFNTYGKKLFNGNILNWALMSRLSVMKKVIMGGKFEPRPNDPQRIVFEGSDWVAGSVGCKWTITGGTTLVISDKGVPEPCDRYEKNTTWNNIKIDITSPYENTRGVFQEFTDNYTGMTNSPPPDVNFDKNSPRFGLTDFGTGGTAVIDKKIPQDNPMNDYFTAVQNVVNQESHPLATAHKAIIDYFDDESPVTGTDPYKSCVSYESPCISPAPCRKSFILMITSGGDVTGNTVASLPTECSATETRPLVKNACYAYNTDLRDDTQADGKHLPGKQNLSTYAVQTFGTPTGLITSCGTLTGNAKVLCDAAVAGGGQYYQAGINDLDGILRKALQDIIKRAAAGTAASVLASGEGSGANLIQAVFYPRAMTIPKGGIFGAEIDWIGRLVNYWYYVDPFFAASSIYEDNASNKKLNLTDDNKIELYFDPTTERTKARRFYDNTPKDGVPETLRTPDIEFEKLSSIWEAGAELWKRTSARTIKTTIGGGLIDFSTDNASTLKSYFDLPTTDSDLNGYADGDLDRDGDVDNADAGILIGYIQGEDVYPYLRSRTTAVNLDPVDDNDTSDAGEAAKVWKLADVLNSTPKISSWIPLNTYDQKYKHLGETSYKDFIDASDYKSRGMVFAGANDGMLHAFKLGTLDVTSGTGYEKARLCVDSNSDGLCSDTEVANTTGLGTEAWAFIPKNTLPYLRYLTDPGYCHIYTIDLTPYLFDVSIGTTNCTEGNYADCLKTGVANPADRWRTILIGGMRYGGACREPGSTGTDNVKAPVAGLGYSSYFALDVTDQYNPTLLWEFSNAELGFTTTGPAVVRVSAKDGVIPNNYKNGHWFVVFGSGPTGPISTTDQQFMGRSDQKLKLFVLDLKTGALATTNPIDTQIPYAFAGSMLNTTIDPDSDYQDDVVYIPYVKRTGAGTVANPYTWTQGGIGRLVTSEHIDPSDVTKWKWSVVIDDIGPVTSSVANLINKSRGQLWLYFGSGRYYFEQGVNTDDATGQRQIFGIKEPCYSLAAGFMPDCTTSRSFCTTPCSNPTTSPPCTLPLDCGDIKNVTDITKVPSDPTAAGYYGWYINLDPAANPNDPDAVPNCSGGDTTSCTGGKYGYCEGNPASVVCRDYRAERIITDPLTTTTGLAFFTAYKPYKDECTFGGKSFIWATKYDTGGAPGALVKGIALVQVSTGAIEQVDLSKVFTLAGKRKSGALEGVPPTAQGLSLVSTPPPVKRVLHIRER